MKKVLCALIVLVASASVSFAQLSVSGTAAAAHPDNVLRYDVSFTVSSSALAYVEYGYWNGTDSIWNGTHVEGPGTNHTITVVGLMPSTDYHFRAVAMDSTGCYAGTNLATTTTAIPAGLGVGGMDSTWAPAGAEPQGYILTNTAEANPNRMTQIFTRDGDLVWYQEMPGDPDPAMDGLCQHFNFDYKSNTLFYTTCDHVTELDFDGSILEDVNVHAADANLFPHHEAFRHTNGNIVAVVSMLDTVDKTSVGGPADALVVGQGIVEFDDQGNVAWQWSNFDDYSPLNSPGPGGYWTPKFGADAIDWMHANA
ncbi:MAG: aryl-sulfate sulfotransferase, partial [Bacteroidota bacterium]